VILRCARCDSVYDDEYDSCPVCARASAAGEPSHPADASRDFESRLAALELDAGENAALLNNHAGGIDACQDRIEELEEIINSSNVYQSEFWPRAWAILGHAWVASLVFQAALLVAWIALFVILGRSH